MNVAIYNFVSKTIDEVVWNTLLHKGWINVCIKHSTVSSLIFLSSRGFRCMIFWKGENTSIRFNNWKLIQMGRRWRERRKKRGEEKVINLRWAMEKVYFYPSPQTDLGVLTTQLLALLKPGANWTKLTHRVVFFVTIWGTLELIYIYIRLEKLYFICF